MSKKGSAEETIKTIRRKTRRKHSAEEKIRIVLEGLRGEQTVAELCRLLQPSPLPRITGQRHTSRCVLWPQQGGINPTRTHQAENLASETQKSCSAI